MVRYPLCFLPCTLANEVQLFAGLGLYSGLFVMYLQYQSTGTGTGTGRKATIVFYATCLLYVLSTIDFVSDLLNSFISNVSNDYICRKNIIF